MNLNVCMLTNNACYKVGRKITPKGVMVHSTGANNPNLKRYVGPDDGKLGYNQYGNHWNQDKPDGREVCAHAFIGKLADGSVATYQTLPWDARGWHCGKGSKGSANDTHISFEICEDALTDSEYFSQVYREAVELCAYLCDMYEFDPMADGVVICHSEGAARGIASNHSDVMHWFPKFGKNMDIFRADVKAAMEGTTPAPSPAPNTAYQVGDVVTLSSYYAASTDPIEKAVIPSEWKVGTITRIIPDRRNPYLVDGLGWCNDGDIRGKGEVNSGGGPSGGKQYGPNPSLVWDYQYDAQVEELQRILNDKGHSLSVDGKAGDKTYQAAAQHSIRGGESGPLCKWVQQRLNSMGFSCGSADGIAGNKTMKAIAKFQEANGVGVGYLGGTDWYYLLIG